jgi:hypothetical protein
MKIALLSCGPSVELYRGRAGYDAVIGVNRIAARHTVDYWCFGDFATYADNRPLGSPVLVTSDGAAFYVRHNLGEELAERFKGSELLSWEQLDNPLPADVPLCFSSCAALLLASHLGATTVDVYGADMSGERDWDGSVPADVVRTPARWGRERCRWDLIVGWMSDAGVIVNRATGDIGGIFPTTH